MKILERQLGQLDWQGAGLTSTLRLPRNYAYRTLSLRLEANLTTTETTAGVVMDSLPAQLVSNIVIRANGRDVIKNYDMETLHRLTQQRYGIRPRIVSLAATTAAGPGDFTVNAVIDFQMWRAVKPIDTLLDSSGMATLEMIVTWGAANSVFGGAFGGTVTVNSCTLYVASVESIGVPTGSRFMVNKEFSIREIITAANAQHQINLPVGNLYRSIVLKTVSDACNVNTILNNIILKSGTEVFKNRTAVHLQMDNRVDYMTEFPVATAILENLFNGYYLLEFVKDGRLSECLDTSRLSSLELVLDINAPGTVDSISVYAVELIVPPKINNA
ncbi:hypothetical protein ES702_05952 [subsurface metagenome]